MRDDLDNMNPAFTIRRQFQHAQEELEMLDELRRVRIYYLQSVTL